MEMDIKVTISDKSESRKPKGTARATGMFTLVFFVASLVCSRVYIGVYHSKDLFVLSVFFGILSGIFLLAFLVSLANRASDGL